MSKVSFPALEIEILNFWKENDTFRKSLKLSHRQEFKFYDGPPFATGLPHYGHILASVIKDVVTRYMSQRGFHVERQWGWDTHGVPIEFEIEKTLGIKTKEDVEKIGMEKYCESCRQIVLKYSTEWESTITRLGRWVDFKDCYRTMDLDYMSKVWSVFSKLYQKGLVYKGYKVMPYSSHCTTPLSNFEANQNYKKIKDPELYVKFKILNSEHELPTFALVMTTTPWTLPCNMTLCINHGLIYQFVKVKDEIFLLAKDLVESVIGDPKSEVEVEVVSELTGEELLGLKLEYSHLSGVHGIISDNFVTSTAGTGIVHIAPAFGVDDYRVCLENSLIEKDMEVPCPFDANCRFTSSAQAQGGGLDLEGIYFRDANPLIIEHLQQAGLVFKVKTIEHDYPFCWRSDTPLMYRAVPSWFVKVDSEGILRNLEKTHWVPSHIRDKRFGNWIRATVDWCVSRNRYWGTPLPVWTNGKETIVVDSATELEKLTGLPAGSIKDLHRDKIDNLLIPSKIGGPPLKRISEVFDCWFESGSMPFATHKDTAASPSPSPADFIAEGLDQTRGWFYTLMVISNALLDQPAFKNVIVNGLVLAEDGQKMSKRLKNYPAPTGVIEEFGSDALRMYLIQSKAVQGEELKFSKDGLRVIVQTILLPLHNSLELLMSYLESDTEILPLHRRTNFPNLLDNWILQKLDTLLKGFNSQMSEFKLSNIVSNLEQFITALSKNYINLNKDRIKSGDRQAVSTLYHCLYNVALMISPVAPFYAETIYQKLKVGSQSTTDSVHLQQIPDSLWYNNDKFINKVDNLFTILESIRILREKNEIARKCPLKSVTIYHPKDRDFKEVESYIMKDGNVLSVIYSTEPCNDSDLLKVQPNFKVLGKKHGSLLKKIKSELESDSVSQLQLRDLLEHHVDSITVAGVSLILEDLIIKKDTTVSNSRRINNGDFTVEIDTTRSREIDLLHHGRKIVAAINKMRQKLGLTHRDHVNLYYSAKTKISKVLNCQLLETLLEKNQEKYILPLLKQKIHNYNPCLEYFYRETVELFDIEVEILFNELEKEIQSPLAV